MKLTIVGEMTDLNTFIAANRANRFGGARIKEDETQRVVKECMIARLKPVTKYPVRVIFTWHCRNARKDIDNVAFAKKFILDGLVEAGVIENDDRKHVAEFADHFCTDARNPRVDVELVALHTGGDED